MRKKRVKKDILEAGAWGRRAGPAWESEFSVRGSMTTLPGAYTSSIERILEMYIFLIWFYFTSEAQE